MKQTMAIFIFLIAALFLVGCAKTAVVKIDEKAEKNETTAVMEKKPAANESAAPTNQTAQPKVPPQTTDITGKTAVKCQDTDADDKFTSGRVTVTYSDGSKNDFIDECPAKNEVYQTEYVCVGNDVDSKLNTCKSPCVAGICIE